MEKVKFPMHVCMCECLLIRLHENVFCLGT